MAVLVSRSHLVTFRLSTEEYESLKTICTLEGARSFSDFSRAAVLDRLRAYKSKRVTLADDLTTLSLRLVELDRTLSDLRSRIGRILGKDSSKNSNGGQRDLAVGSD